MRRSVILATAVLMLVSSAALGRGQADAAVRIASPEKVFVPHERVRQLCGAERPVDACTQFDSLTLTCDCQLAGARWRVHSQFSATTRVVLAESSFLLHELGHVQDFRSLIGRYLTSVAAVSYPTALDCEEAAINVKATFASKLDDIRRISANRRDHTPQAGAVRVRFDPGLPEDVPTTAAAATGPQSGAATDDVTRPPVIEPW